MHFIPQPGIGFGADGAGRMALLPTPPRWTRHYVQFLLLRSQEILRLLATTERTEHHVYIFRAAGRATTLAWQTDFPLLMFPELFRELAGASLNHARVQELHNVSPNHHLPDMCATSTWA